MPIRKKPKQSASQRPNVQRLCQVPTSEELKSRRKELRLTQSEAAAFVGVSARTWNYWESGEIKPRKGVLFLLEGIKK